MSLKARLRQLERHYAPERVLGVQIDDGPVTVNGEEMTCEAFEERYPAGDILHVVYVNQRPQQSQQPLPTGQKGERGVP